MGAASEAVPDLGDALILVIIGVAVVVLSVSQVWAALRHRALYGLGGIVYDEASPDGAAFWGYVLLLLGAIAIGGWIAAHGVTEMMRDASAAGALDYIAGLPPILI